MNERIKELIAQATVEVRSHGAFGESERYSKLDPEKFAELIVRECMSVCKSRVGNSDYNTGRMWCASDIKKHFGVE